MTYKIVVSPELSLAASELVETWNADEACRTAAHAEIETARQAEAFDPAVDMAVFILGNLALGLTANAIYDLLKRLLAKKGVAETTEIRHLKQPDGTEYWVITKMPKG